MTDIKSIHEHTELAEVPATADEVLVWDASAAAHRRVSRANYLGYTEYVALLTQSGTNAPTAVEIKNDTGATVTWSYVSTGVYHVTFSSAVLTDSKTVGIITGSLVTRNYRGSVQSTTVYRVTTGSFSSPLNDVLSSTPVIIRIYV